MVKQREYYAAIKRTQLLIQPLEWISRMLCRMKKKINLKKITDSMILLM